MCKDLRPKDVDSARLAPTLLGELRTNLATSCVLTTQGETIVVVAIYRIAGNF